MPLYPIILNSFKYDNTCHLLQGPVVIKIDSGTGQITVSVDQIIFHEKMHEEGVNKTIVITNTNVVTQDMDGIFKTSKIS